MTSAAPWSAALDRVRVAGSVVVHTGAQGFAVERVWRRRDRSAVLFGAAIAGGAATVALLASGAGSAVAVALYMGVGTAGVLLAWAAATFNRTLIVVEEGVLTSRQRPIALRPPRAVRASDVADIAVRLARKPRGDAIYEVVVTTKRGAELVVCEGPEKGDLNVVQTAIRERLFGAR